jgi:molybdate-binding protein/DNA-binding XRE family transcriptional regulator
MKNDSPTRNQLRSLRNRLALSQQELADAAGVTRQTIGGIEVGHFSPSVTVALRLAKALGCRVEDVFWHDEDVAVIQAERSALLTGSPEAERVALTRVGSRWVAHPLAGAAAFRTQMTPADGVTVCGDAKHVQVRALDEVENLSQTVALAGCTPVLSLWAGAAERWNPGLRVHWSFANSTQALDSLARGEVHAAGLHLCDPATGEFNTPFVKRAMGGKDVALFNLGVWAEGLAVAPAHAGRIKGVADLVAPDLHIVNREPGAGARLVLDEALRLERIPTSAVLGYDREARGHLEVAQEILEGRASAGVTTAGVAHVFGLAFVPLQEVRYDLAVLKEHLDHPPVRRLFATLEHRWVRTQLQMLGGYDTARTGELIAEVGRAA